MSSRYSEHQRRRQTREDERTREERVRESIDRAATALSDHRQDHATVADELASVLLPELVGEDGQRIARYDRVLEDESGWAPGALRVSVRRLCRAGEQPRPAVVEAALRACEAVAAYEGIVDETVRKRSDAVGWATKLGEHHQAASMDFADPVELNSRARGAQKTMFTGPTGSGKSVGAAALFEDYYRQSVADEGREYKLFDIVDTSEGENITADLPQKQGDLRERRIEHGLAPDWRGIDGYEPDLEILVPLSRGLSEAELPHEVESGEPVPRPFVVPASDLSESLLVSMLVAYVSPKQERTLRDAYKRVEREHADWSLADLGEEIRSRDDLSDKHTTDVLRALRNLQAEGWIRTREHPYAIDWDELQQSTETITAFSQHKMDSDRSRYLLIAYLLDKLYEERQRSHTYPQAVVWVREFWQVAAHQETRRKYDDPIANVMERIVAILQKIQRMVRHIDLELIADTQETHDAERSVRRRFNRYAVYGSNDASLGKMLGWTGNNKDRQTRQQVRRTIPDDDGAGALIGVCEPVVNGPANWGVSPIYWSPPSWHTVDTDNVPDGWVARCRVSRGVDAVPDEELDTPDWDTSVPDELLVDVEADGEGGAEEAELPPDQLKDHHRELARQWYRQNGWAQRKIAQELPPNPDTGESYSKGFVQNAVAGVDKGAGQSAQAGD